MNTVEQGKSNGAGVANDWLMQGIILNALTSRSELIRRYLDPRRSIDDECGYPQTGTMTPAYYKDLYDREPVATRVVQLMPKESWVAYPSVFEDDGSDVVTPFEEAFDALSDTLRGESWYTGEEGNPLWEALARVDELCGIGSYGILLMGMDDKAELDKPAQGVDDRGRMSDTPGSRSLLYLRAFDESQLSIAEYEKRPDNPRFGQPVFYSVQLCDANDESKGGIGLPTVSVKVHWSRVIHVADNLGSSEVFGVPRMRPVLNPILDIRKVRGSDAEGYWKNVIMRLFLETHPQLGGDVVIDAPALREVMEKMENGLQRWATLSGMSAKTIAPAVVDPTPHIDVQLQSICIQLGCPLRVFLGSERGELASSQDARAWNDRVKGRRDGHLTPRLVVPFVNRCICLGVLPEPEEYAVTWPGQESLSKMEEAQVAVARTDAITKFVGGNGEALMSPMDFLTRIMGMTDEEAEAVLEAAVEGMKEKEEEAAVQQEEQMKQMAKLNPQGVQPLAPGKPGTPPKGFPFPGKVPQLKTPISTGVVK